MGRASRKRSSPEKDLDRDFCTLRQDVFGCYYCRRFILCSSADTCWRGSSLCCGQHYRSIERGVFAGSSILAKQIENGAPADLYLSANPAWMDYLEARGHIVAATRRDLLANRLVVIVREDSASKFLDLNVDLIAALGEGRLALGDPDHVPAGIYARQALEAMGSWSELETRLVRATDVRIALHLVARGEAPLGIVYASDAKSIDGVRVVGEIATGLHAPIRYAIALVAGRNNKSARRFIEFLKTPEMEELFHRHGFGLP